MSATWEFISCCHSGACSESLLACFLQASADTSVNAKSADPKLATLCMQMTLENTGYNQTSRTLVQIQNFYHQNNQEKMYFTERCIWFSRARFRAQECLWIKYPFPLPPKISDVQKLVEVLNIYV